MTDEDKEDLKTYNQAMAEHLKNPVVYSHEEVSEILDIPNALKSILSPTDTSAGIIPLKNQKGPA